MNNSGYQKTGNPSGGGANRQTPAPVQNPELENLINYKGGNIDIDLFSKKAEKWAEKIYNSGEGKKNKHSQIRKFYDEVTHFQSMIKNSEDEFKKLLPYIKMLHAKVAYAQGRDHVTEEFTKFIHKNLEQVETIQDLNVFVSFFEAFMGYLKYQEVKKIKF